MIELSPIIMGGQDITKPVGEFEAVQEIHSARVKETAEGEVIQLLIKQPTWKYMKEPGWITVKENVIEKQFPQIAHLKMDFWPKKLKGKFINTKEIFPNIRTKEELKKEVRELKKGGMMELEFTVAGPKKVDGKKLRKKLQYLYGMEHTRYEGKHFFRNLEAPDKDKNQAALDLDDDDNEVKKEKIVVPAEKKWNKILTKSFKLEGEGDSLKLTLDVNTEHGMVNYDSEGKEIDNLLDWVGDQILKCGDVSRIKSPILKNE